MDPNDFKERELAVKEKTANKAQTLAELIDKRAGLKEGTKEWKAADKAVKDFEKHEINKEGVRVEAAESRQIAVENRATKRAEDAARKTATTQGIAEVNKYYDDLAKSMKDRAEDFDATPSEIQSSRDILKNIPAYRNLDLQAVRNGQEPRNVKNLNARESGRTTASGPRRLTYNPKTKMIE
jgi:hypothetical protein